MRLLDRTLAPLEAQLEGHDDLLRSFTAADTITGHACVRAGKFGADLSDKPDLAARNGRLPARPAGAAGWDA